MKRTGELRDALGAPTALDADDERSFEEQMRDVGVEVVKPKITWYKTMTQRRGKVGLKDKISLNKGGLTFGTELAEKIGTEMLNFGLYEKGGKKAIAIQPGKKDGLRIHRTRANSYRVSSQALTKFFLGHGMPLGKYSVHEIKGGWLAVPEGKR